MKKIILSLLVVLLILGNITIAGASDEITVMVFEKKIAFDQQPVIENGRTLVPLRAIFEALNAEVSWDEPTKTVTAYKITAFKEEITVKLQIGSQEMNVYRTDSGENKKVTLDVPAKIINDRTLVPVRAISESLDCEVLWVPVSSTVVITPFDADEKVLTCNTLDGNLDSITVLDYKGRVIKDIVYSGETGKFENMYKYDFSEENKRNVTVYYADGSIDSYTEEYFE